MHNHPSLFIKTHMPNSICHAITDTHRATCVSVYHWILTSSPGMLQFQGIRVIRHSSTEHAGQGPAPEDPNPTEYGVNASAGTVRTHDQRKGGRETGGAGWGQRLGDMCVTGGQPEQACCRMEPGSQAWVSWKQCHNPKEPQDGSNRILRTCVSSDPTMHRRGCDHH